jgi:hypothetical protein
MHFKRIDSIKHLKTFNISSSNFLKKNPSVRSMKKKGYACHWEWNGRIQMRNIPGEEDLGITSTNQKLILLLNLLQVATVNTNDCVK